MHAKVQANIQKSNQKYKEKADRYRYQISFNQISFKESDLVWFIFAKHFPPGHYGKLQNLADGSFRERIGENTYQVDLPSD